MEEEQQQPNALSSTFPTPPPFWQSFNPENIARIAELREAQRMPASTSSDLTSKTTDPALPTRLLDLPAELRCLQPPEPPLDGRYRCFGDIFDVRLYTPSRQDAIGLTKGS
jgi:mediator of RNA polymerase II transcription subunit 7